jgi:hypothetical protein
MLDALADGMRQLLAYRNSLSVAEQRAQFLDVAFNDIQNRPLETLRRIYDVSSSIMKGTTSANLSASLTRQTVLT